MKNISTLPLYHPERLQFQQWVDSVGKNLYKKQNPYNGFKNVKSMEELYQQNSLYL